MAKLEILRFPDERLRTKAKPVESVDDSIRQLVEDMFETMYAAPGIGLAATQINVHQRIVVIDISEEKDQPHCKPDIVHRGFQEWDEQNSDEGLKESPYFPFAHDCDAFFCLFYACHLLVWDWDWENLLA